jgi:dodecin
MTNRVYEIIELVGTSNESIEKVIDNGVGQAKNANKKLD